MRLWYGIRGNGPRDRMASIGELEFTLGNWPTASGRPQGYYSPNHANVRSGWTFGVPVRLVVNTSSAVATKFRGKLHVIDPEAGSTSTQRVHCLAFDHIRDFAEFDVRAVTEQINQTERQLIQAVITAMPVDAQPPATDLDAALDTYPYAFHDIGDGVKAQGLIQDVLDSCQGYGYCKGDGTWKYENRQARLSKASAFTFTNGMHGLIVPSDLSNVYNHFKMVTHPATVDAAATTVIYKHRGIPAIAANGGTLTISGAYYDPDNENQLIGGTAGVTPVSGTDFIANSASDGSGTNLTSSVTVTATFNASTVELVLTNNHASSTAHFTTLQVRGKGIYDLSPTTFEASSTQDYGDRPITIDLFYQDDPDTAAALAAYYEAQYRSLSNQANSLTIYATPSTTHMTQVLQREPGDVITVTETMTGLSAVELVIHSVEITITPGPWLVCTWGLAPKVSTETWILEDAVKGLLETSTILGSL